MLSTSTRLRLQNILTRISRNEQVTLTERVYLHKFADRDQTVSAWLIRARKLQQQTNKLDSIDNLLFGLDICPSDPCSEFKSDYDDLGEWFGGAPSWVGRS